MFKLFIVYPIVALICFWLASDVEVKGSLLSFSDNHISIEFPKKQFRPDYDLEPWYSFYWNAESARDELKKINDAVVN